MSASNRLARQQNLAKDVTPVEDTTPTDGSVVVGRNFTLAELIFPATILRFAREEAAFEIITFSDKDQFVMYLANTMGVYRWIKPVAAGVDVAFTDEIVNAIKDVPTQTLLAIYNRTRGDSPLDRFRNRETAERRTAEVIMNVSVQYQDTDMAKKAAETGQPKAEAKAEERAAAKKLKEENKAKLKEENKAATEAKRADGVIGTIKSFIDSPSGGTQAEMLDSLVAKFPTRTRDGMSSTVKIQCSRLAKSTGRTIVNKDIQGRGRVYKFADLGAIPGVEVVKEVAAPKTDNAPAAATPAEAAPASA